MALLMEFGFICWDVENETSQICVFIKLPQVPCEERTEEDGYSPYRVVAQVQTRGYGYWHREAGELELCFKGELSRTWRCVGCKGFKAELSSDSRFWFENLE